MYYLLDPQTTTLVAVKTEENFFMICLVDDKVYRPLKQANTNEPIVSSLDNINLTVKAIRDGVISCRCMADTIKN